MLGAGDGEGTLSARPGADSAGAGQGGKDAQGRWHIVAKGDTLWGIAQQYGAALERLVELNPDIRNPNLIYVGQRVRIA